MTTSTIWISYDLGVRGDYEGMYSWLDAQEAKECGDSLAVLSYEYKGSLITSLKNDMKKYLDTDKRTRIYVIYRDKTSNKNKGRFIFGGRRSAAWTGFASNNANTVDEEV